MISKKRIGIISYHHAYNYGAYLQACALCNRLNQEEFFECEIINFRMKKEQDFYDYHHRNAIKRAVRFKKSKFVRTLNDAFERAYFDSIMPLSKNSLVSDSIDEFNAFVKGKYDIIISGSDEVWKVDSCRGFPTPYWLHDDLSAIKVSYAASSRNRIEQLRPEEIDYIRKALDSFKIISVRDIYTKRLVDEILGREVASITCDPSFIYDFEVPVRSVSSILTGKCKIDPGKKNMVVMVSDKKLAMKLLKFFRHDYNMISVFEYNLGYQNVGELTPKEWLQLIKNADAVVTTYFHATCFCLIYNTPFLTFGSIRSSKIEGLFHSTKSEIAQHYISETESFLNREDAKKTIIARLHRIKDIDDYLIEKRNMFNLFLEALKAVAFEDKIADGSQTLFNK